MQNADLGRFVTYIYVYYVCYLTIGPQPLPKRVLHNRVPASASSFSFQYLPFSL